MSAALCVIPGCRIRGRHAPGCDDADCAGCLPRTADDGNVCQPDRDRIADRLDAIAQLAPDARLTARGLVKRGGGSGSNKPGSRPPLNDHATDVLDQVTNSMTTWARHIIETRGITGPTGSGDALAVVARFLGANLGWLVHRPEIDEFAGDVGDCAGRLRSLVNGPAEQRFLGPCGAESFAINPESFKDITGTVPAHVVCEGDVYGYRGAPAGRCRLCGTEVSTAEREAWLDGEVRSRAFRPAHIADAHGLRANTIVKWHARGKLQAYWVTGAGLTAPWTDPPVDPDLEGDELAARRAEVEAELEARGPKVFYVGDVLDLAAADAARRETNRAKRERRLTMANTEEDAA